MKICPECGDRVERGPRAIYCSSACGRRVHQRSAYVRRRQARGVTVLEPRERRSRLRPIKLIGEDGEPVRTVTHDDVLTGLMTRRGLAVEVRGGVRPSEVPCSDCGVMVVVPEVGGIPLRCDPCRCGVCVDCGALLGGAGKVRRRALKAGRELLCRDCTIRRNRPAVIHCKDCGCEVAKGPRCRACSQAARDPVTYRAWWKAGLASRKERAEQVGGCGVPGASRKRSG